MISLSVLALLYFLPTIVAVNRGHEVTPILLFNLLLGWTGIGWCAMLLWALFSHPLYYIVPAPPPPGPYAHYYDPNHPYWRRY